MTKEELKRFLDKLFPDFKNSWEGEGNYHKEDNGNYTYHGLFSEFSNYFRDNFSKFAQKQMQELFEKIEEWVAADPNDQSNLANAACTCFLENIAGEVPKNELLKFIGTESLKYYSNWDK